eukprot:TRINITY_DN4427_c0_g2_i1.p1 TRINITY_DN4427_c0_g2~~TRINITY_DN4427_c0_g2_i1.p1  ORF type:complete len:1024 (+),score=203.08 TRINITY_DN4427_c0_g2_i1:213-3284(+)
MWVHLALLILLVSVNQHSTNAAPAVPAECSGGALSINSGGGLLFSTVNLLFNLLGIGSGAPKPCAPTGVTSNVTSNSILQATLNLVTDLLVEITDDMSVSGIFLSSDSAQRAARASAKVDLDGCASCTTVYGPLSSLIIGTAGSVYAANGFSVQQNGTLRIQGLLSGASVRGDRAYPTQNQPIFILPTASLIADGMLGKMSRGASISVGGTFSVLAASKLVVDASNLTLQADSISNVAGTLQLLNGRLSINSAPLSISPNGLLLVSGSTLLTTSAGAFLSLSPLGNFTVDVGASLDASGSNFKLSQASTASSLIAGTVSSGQFNVQGGFLTVSGSVNTQSNLLNSLASATITGSLTSTTSLLSNTNSFLSGSLSSSNITLDSSTSLSVLGSGSLVSSTLQINPRSTLQLGGIASVGNLVQLGGEISLNGEAVVGAASLSGSGILSSLGGMLNVSTSLVLTESAQFSVSDSAHVIIGGSISASLRAGLVFEQSVLRVGASLSVASNSSILGKLGSSLSIGAQLALSGNSSALLDGASLAVQTSISLSDHAALVVKANAEAAAGSGISVLSSSTLAVLDSSLATSTNLAVTDSQLLVGLSGQLSIADGVTLLDSDVEVNGLLAASSLESDTSILVIGSQGTINLDRADLVGGTLSLLGASTINSSLTLAGGATVRVLGSLQSTNTSAVIKVIDSSLSIAASGSILFGSLSVEGASDLVVDGSSLFKQAVALAPTSTVTVSGSIEADTITAASRSLKLTRGGLLKAREVILSSGTHEIQGTIESIKTTIGSKAVFPSNGSPAEMKSQNVTVSPGASVSGDMNSNSSMRNDGQVGSPDSSTNVTADHYEQSSSGSMETSFSGSSTGSTSSTTVYTNTAQIAGTLIISTPSSPALGSQYSVVQCSSNCQGSFDSISTSGPNGAATRSCEWKQTTSPKSIAVLFVGSEGCSDSINGNGSTASDEWRNIIAIVVPCAIIAIAAIATAIVMANPAWRIKAMPFLIRRNPAKYAKYAGQGVQLSNSQDPLVD